ncbi:unnamed protein product [Calicophoron daubneyi]|uniref:Integrator complex subunit 3 n=1 Tax=Calicophoron daubneyi TaxID=300641 RepID=A0AAV2T7I2_CALDB
MFSFLIILREWLGSTDRQAFLLPLTVITLLRLIPDHHAPAQPGTVSSQSPSLLQISLATLRQRELALVEDLVRKHFDRCAQIGRDFIRLLHGIARIEPIKRLWEDILDNISSLSSHFSSVGEILEITTPQCFTQTFIPHEMEQWIRWMMKNVHCIPRVPVSRYQDFFQRKFFSTPESQSLRVCLVRYIVTYFYPDNEMLASTLIPRWNVISWILSQSTCPVATTNAKLALFYDWLFFKPNDCIMNLEPALLAIMNHLTVRTQPIALSLVEFLVKIVANYHPTLTDRIVIGVRGGLEEMIRLGVVKNLNPLFEMLHRTSLDLVRALRALLGLEPQLAPPLSDLTSRPNPIEKADIKGDATVGAVPPSAVAAVTVANVVGAQTLIPGSSVPGIRRPSTPPIVGAKPKAAAVPTGDTGAPTDPRLTRGHAAILAGAVPPTAVGAAFENNLKSTPQVDAVQSGQSISSAVQSPNPTPNLNSVGPQELRPSNVRRPIVSLPVPNTPQNRIGQSEHFLSDDDLDKLEVDGVDPMDPRLSRAIWSPPPLPPSQTIYRSRTDQLPATPESMELTIDSLRRRFQEYQLRYRYSVEPVDVNALMEQLDGPIRGALESFRDVALRVGLVRASGNKVSADRDYDELEARPLNGCVDEHPNGVRLRSPGVLGDLCESMETLVQAVLSEDCFDDIEIASRTAGVVCELLFLLFAERLMPNGSEWSEEQLEDCLAFPIFVPFRHLSQMNPGDPKREQLLLLLTEMQARQPRLGYHLLFFLKVGRVNDEKMTTYRNFCSSQENPNLRDSLFKDMQLLADDNRRLFAYLLPEVFTVFPDELVGDVGFLRLVVGTLDPGMCNTLICEIVRGHLNMFQPDDISQVLKASLEWNSIEQFFFWQLINAHEIPTRSFLPLVRCVEPSRHPEACSNLILLFKLEKPSYELVRALLSRPGPDDSLSVTALHFWSCPDNQHASRFSGILSAMITAPLSFRGDTNPGGSTVTSARDAREKRRNLSKHHLSPENCVDLSLILTHLDAIRRSCKNISLLQNEDIQLALQAVANSRKVALSVKDHFSDLLALAEDQPTSPSAKPNTSKGSSSSSSQSESSSRLNGNLVGAEGKKSLGSAGRSSLGSKGGHSLRNLDSRRAAEAERRQAPASSAKRSTRSNTSTVSHSTNDDDSDNEDAEAISLVSSSSASSSSEDEEKPVPVSQKTRRSRHDSSSGSRQSGVTNKRRASTKRASVRLEGDDDSSKSDEEEDEDEKGLEVVVLDDSGDEKGENNVDEDNDKVRPPKRRKTSGKRFILDD